MTKIKCICERCKSVFYTYLSRIESGRGKYCSRKCYDISKIGKPTWRIHREIILKDNCAFVPLSTDGIFTVIDKDDIEKVNKYTWHLDKKGKQRYVIVNITYNRTTTKIYLHRFIMNCPKNMTVDHINHNGLDNRKNNLRICTNRENSINSRKRRNTSSIHKGVSWDKSMNKWQSYIKNISKKEHLGYFDDETEAAKIYNKRAIELFGEFAYPNNVI